MLSILPLVFYFNAWRVYPVTASGYPGSRKVPRFVPIPPSAGP
jgi:hypothetical protein